LGAGLNARSDRPHHLGICGSENQVLHALLAGDRAVIDAHAERVELTRGETLFTPTETLRWAYFPNVGTVVSLYLLLGDGRMVEAATTGCEGVLGSIVSCGTLPAFGSAAVQISGHALRVPIRVVEDLKDRSPSFRRLFDRHAYFLLAQALQSVACNTFHHLEARLCRWLLTTQDRVGKAEIPLTQEALADMLGVQRTTVSTMGRGLQDRGLLYFRRGFVEIVDREAVERASCECYDTLERYRLTIMTRGPKPAGTT